MNLRILLKAAEPESQQREQVGLARGISGSSL